MGERRRGGGGAGGAMAVGKNKRLTKGKKGSKKKQVDPFTKKDWYDLKAPTMFATRTFGKTLVTRTQGTKTATDGLKGRKFDMCQADLNKDEDIQGRNCLTQFDGMTLTTTSSRACCASGRR